MKYQKIKVWSRLCGVKTENLLSKTMRGKILGTKYENPVKLERARKVWYLL